MIVLSSIAINNLNFDKTEIIPIADASLNEYIHNNLAGNVDIYGTGEEFEALKDGDTPVLGQIDIYPKKDKEDEKVYVDDTIKKDNITFTVVGEIMMGAEITENLDYMYPNAFKNIHKYTRDADFTYGILGTNITSLDKLSNVKSKYIVTKGISQAFTSLGIDALNIATDHITDYDRTIFVTTLDVLKNNSIYMTGIKDSTLYVNIYGKKVAIISALSSYIGGKQRYEEFGINLYNEAKMNEDIKNAKDNADFVIVDVSWGRDDKFGVTRQMNKIAVDAINSGANLVLGSNALGIYPIEIYNGVPIIYSTGYLITDSDLTLAKRSYIWQFGINKENKLTSLKMIPICTENKTITNEFRVSNPQICMEYSMLINGWNRENNINSSIDENGCIIINF